MKRIKFVALFALMLFGVTWLFPVKKTVTIDTFDMTSYIKQGKVILVCHGTNMTDTQFMVTDSYGIEDCPHHIKYLTGESPEEFLRVQIDDYYDDVSFLLVGEFEDDVYDLNESYIFRVDQWYPLYPIRRSLILWYPPYGFNAFEMRL